MNHGSLFSGIGGFELAAEWIGWDNLFHCEFNDFGSKVLNHYWPESKHYGDITKSDFSEFRDRIDILTGGFPCQPYSAAGKRKGKDDARHLWPEMLRVIREVRPRYIVGENVYGLVTWNGGLVFDEVCSDLEAEGYAIWPIVIPATAVNAPHRRDRVWFVAYSESIGLVKGQQESRQEWSKYKQQGSQIWSSSTSISQGGLATDSDLHGCDKCNGEHEKYSSQRRLDAFGNLEQSFVNGLTTDSESVLLQRQCSGQRQGKFRRGNWDGFPTESPVCSGDDGLPTKLDGITFPKWRNESIKAYGNAIVPQVAYQIFKAIDRLEKVK
jgi:DNA (cytosine-5)-methyltransferase 1